MSEEDKKLVTTEETAAKEGGEEKPKEEESTATFEPVVRSILFGQRVVLYSGTDRRSNMNAPGLFTLGRVERSKIIAPYAGISTQLIFWN